MNEQRKIAKIKAYVGSSVASADIRNVVAIHVPDGNVTLRMRGDDTDIILQGEALDFINNKWPLDIDRVVSSTASVVVVGMYNYSKPIPNEEAVDDLPFL